MTKSKFQVGSIVNVDWIGKGKRVPAKIRAKIEESGKWVYLVYDLESPDHIMLPERNLSNG